MQINGKKPCSWIGIINIVEMSKLIIMIYRFSAVTTRIPMAFSIEIGQIILKLVYNYK